MALAAVAAACSPEQAAPSISDAHIPAPPAGATVAAGYATIHNPSKRNLQLQVSGSSQFESVEIHQTTMEDGMARMRMLDSLAIPAGGEVKFEPGGAHLMFFGPRQPAELLKEVEVNFTLTGSDGKAETLRQSFRVDAAPSAPEDQHLHH